jgi:hypothetical protein
LLGFDNPPTIAAASFFVMFILFPFASVNGMSSMLA